jgi:hypothetical protein
MLDKLDHRIRPELGIIDGEIVSIDAKEMPERLKCGPLIPLLESMSASDAGHQYDSEGDNVFLAKTVKIPRSRQSALKQTAVAQEVLFSSRLHLKPVMFDHGFYGQPPRFIWQGRLGSSDISP